MGWRQEGSVLRTAGESASVSVVRGLVPAPRRPARQPGPVVRPVRTEPWPHARRRVSRRDLSSRLPALEGTGARPHCVPRQHRARGLRASGSCWGRHSGRREGPRWRQGSCSRAEVGCQAAGRGPRSGHRPPGTRSGACGLSGGFGGVVPTESEGNPGPGHTGRRASRGQTRLCGEGPGSRGAGRAACDRAEIGFASSGNGEQEAWAAAGPARGGGCPAVLSGTHRRLAASPDSFSLCVASRSGSHDVSVSAVTPGHGGAAVVRTVLIKH